MRLYKQRECFKLTDSCWYPSYRLNGWHRGIENAQLVHVSLLLLTNGNFRVCAWGGDDYGWEKDFLRWQDAERQFVQILELDKVATSYLKARKFVRA